MVTINKTLKTNLILVILWIIIFVSLISASDDVYKPYLHNPTLPEHTKLNLLGNYQTQLWPGAATYNYPIQIPEDNGLNNSHSDKRCT